jgi:N4-(beta-N-acetylglucosaminyl)-L-asparaginase
MDHNYRCGAVMGLEYILHPISVARLVMEKTPHVQLVGEGALKFALESGFEKTNLLTPESERAWKKWLENAKYDPMTTIDNLLERIKNNHDTIGMIAMDAQGNLSGACTTSGMAYKMRGRVGDSPIIGAGLYVDNEVGAATCTGVGEEMVRVCASHTAVEIMRQGKSPEAACKEAVARIVKANGAEKARKLQAAVIAINREGEYGCYSLNSDFAMPVQTAAGVKIIKAPSWF